jgi:hypothetical protein
VAWNQEHRRDPVIELGALDWSVTALADLAPQLAWPAAAGQGRAAAVIGEAVWQVTIVDATLVRYHHEVYDAVLASQPPAERRVTEGTMAGLRFVRNQLARAAGRDALIGPPPGGPAMYGGPAGPCTWQPVPEPAAGSLRSRGRAWEMARYQAYQAFLAGHPVAETFSRAAEFLRLAAAGVYAAAGVSSPTRR